MAGSPAAFTFTETMGGYVSAGASSYRDGARRGRRDGESLRFKVTIGIPDLAAFLQDPAHAAPMTGTIDSAGLGRGLAVDEGAFTLLQRGEDGRLRMGYRLRFHTWDGSPYVLEGYKDVHNDRLVDVWYDTTALFTVLRAEGTEAPGESRGILRIRPVDLVPQVFSMRDPGTRNPLRHAASLARFGWFFGSTLAREYARPPRRAEPGPPS